MTNTLIIYLLFVYVFAVSNATSPKKCNGLKDLCDLRLNQVTFPGSHNAGAGFDGVMKYWSGVSASSCWYRNHGKSYAQQFSFGVRYFDIDTCYGKKEALNCHCWQANDRNCAYSGSIKKGLKQLDSCLRSSANRNEVIILHFNRDSQSGYREKIAKSINDTLMELWAPNDQKKLAVSTYFADKRKWPTLKEAVESNQRIFIFMDNHFVKHLPEHAWVVRSNYRIASSWDTVALSSNCSGITKNAKSKCSSKADFMELAAFGSYGLCTWDMARVCSKWLGEAQNACYDKRSPNGKTVNFLVVDWLDYYRGRESVVNKAKFMNKKNIKKYLGKKIFFPELQGCSYHPWWFYNYCWSYCPEYGWCWVNKYCGKDANVCKKTSLSCHSSCGY